MRDAARRPPHFLRVPPFPGAKIRSFARRAEAGADCSISVDEVRSLRVGGAYWGAQPVVPADHVLVRSASALDAARDGLGGDRLVLWTEQRRAPASGAVRVIGGECDPWHMLSAASAVVLEPNEDELRLIAAVLGTACYVHDSRTGGLDRCTVPAGELLKQALSGTSFENPFTFEPMSTREALELCGFWRRLIDSNRDICGGLGFAFWKQDHVEPLLWSGSASFKFAHAPSELAKNAPVAVWRARASDSALADLDRSAVPLIEVEDGFLRSRGLGADCVPPLSIIADRACAHFDPTRASELESLLQNEHFDEQLLVRAAKLRRVIVESGLGKYGRGVTELERRGRGRRHVLVPGQVEDDRAVQCGGCGLTSNLELLERARKEAPDAYIIYKPHPDVLAGHRRGTIPDRLCRQFADEVLTDAPIASAITMSDEVHVNTSLAGFEALLRGKPVTTYGVPFYAGWGLTRDLGPVPSRRTARRTTDELVAATLLLYPRYLDPVTGLPCSAEVVVARLSTECSADAGMLVGMRRLQGKVMRRLRSLAE